MKKYLIVIFTGMFIIASAATVKNEYIIKNAAIKTMKGIASFYSKNLDGTETSTGEIYRNDKLTAASNFFPLNTWVKVTNRENGASVIVRINDHMAKSMAAKGRIVDLSRKAARTLDFMDEGLAKVTVTQIPSSDISD